MFWIFLFRVEYNILLILSIKKLILTAFFNNFLWGEVGIGLNRAVFHFSWWYASARDNSLETIMAFRGHHGRDHARELYVRQHGASLGKAAGDKIREELHTFHYLKTYLNRLIPFLPNSSQSFILPYSYFFKSPWIVNILFHTSPVWFKELNNSVGPNTS